MQKITFQDLGKIRYKTAWDYQTQIFDKIVANKVSNRDLPEDQHLHPEHHLLFCEHLPVFTLGRSGKMNHLLMSKDFLEENGIEFYENNRGGDITFHGPEQIVGYPILDLDYFFTDIHKYMRLLEEMVIRTMAEYGLEATRSKGETGVWLDIDKPGMARKICAMGVKCSRWVTMHGFAFNINTDLNYFNYIVPCGIQDKGVTSLEKELGRKIDIDEVKLKLKKHFQELFSAELIEKVPKLIHHEK